MALGGMIGGGIFAVLGVVVRTTGALAWAAFVIAGVVALCTGYAFVALDRRGDGRGGSVSFVQQFAGETTLAGMVGWTLLVGYVGSMAMYAFAFGSFFVELAGVRTLFGLPLRPAVSTAAVAGFVALNYVGARASGTSETALVALKVGILLLFGLWGLSFGATRGRLEWGVASFRPTVGPLVAAAVSFVAYQGWQLLLYDRASVADPDRTIPRAVYVSVPVATVVYVLVAAVTVSLAPSSAIQRHPETALAVAAEPFMGQVGFVLVSVAALFSTGSAINATLFSSARLAKGMLSEDLLPDRFGDADADGAPQRTLVLLGAFTAAFTVWGSLQGVTTFASLSFVLVFGGVSFLAVGECEGASVVPPAVATLGAGAFFPLMLWHLYAHERGVFGAVVLVAATVVAVELLYFEREWLVEEVREVGPEV